MVLSRGDTLEKVVVVWKKSTVGLGIPAVRYAAAIFRLHQHQEHSVKSFLHMSLGVVNSVGLDSFLTTERKITYSTAPA
jgi:hypothetical protein